MGVGLVDGVGEGVDGAGVGTGAVGGEGESGEGMDMRGGLHEDSVVVVVRVGADDGDGRGGGGGTLEGEHEGGGRDTHAELGEQDRVGDAAVVVDAEAGGEDS